MYLEKVMDSNNYMMITYSEQDVPGQEAVDDAVNEEHDDGTAHGETVGSDLALPQVVPLAAVAPFFKVGKVGAGKAKGHVGYQTLKGFVIKTSVRRDASWTHHSDLERHRQLLLPRDHEGVGQVKTEKDDAPCSSGNVGPGEEGGQEEAKGDRGQGVGQEEAEDD